jgi:putative phage-type endonuclease
MDIIEPDNNQPDNNESIVEHIKYLIDTWGKNDQRTNEWHQKRGEMLTASEIYKACADASPALKHDIIMTKLLPRETGPNTGGPMSLIWGTRFEPVAKDIYCFMNPGLKIVDTTCIPHPNHPFLGASPDGILISDVPTHPLMGSLIEIKCPITRVLDDSPICLQYMCQMQLQMECTGLETCEFVEMKFKELTYTEWVDSKAEFKSFFTVDDSGSGVHYRHFTDTRSVAEWRASEVNDNPENVQRIIYWELSQYRIQTVKRDPDWLTNNLTSFQEVWSQVLAHRAASTLPQHPKEKATLVL